VNIYNSDGTLTGNRELDGDGNNLTFTAVRKFSLSGDSLDYTLDPAGNLRIGLGNQQFIMRADTASLSRRLSYTGNLGSSFTKHSVVDKNYVDSSITASPSGTVTSVGLSMPTAFVVTNSPVISSGTLTVTGAGVASQYIRGDGQLATLPTTGGGGSSVSYYLNGSVNQGTFGGTPYYEMSKTAIFGAGTDFTISSNGYIASFITDAGDPALLNIPAGNWDFEVYFQSSSASGTPSFYVELYKYDGTTFTLIASSSANPKFITGGTSVDAYYTPLAVPSTSLLVTDRLAVRIYVNNSGNTITLHTEDNNLCQIITTFSTGINALNGLTSQVQYLATGTSGTDFNINSATDTHTFNLPTASATNRGALSSADWSTFNSKIGPSDTSTMLSPYLRKVDTTAMLSPYKTFYPRTAISLTTTGSSGAATYDNSTGVLNIPQYADQFTGTVTSVATNTATGITGGTITTTGTLAIDTNLISTRAWRQKGIDSVASLANSKIGGSGTTNYVSKFTASGTIGNSQIFDNGTNVGIGTTSINSSLEIYKASGPNYIYLTNGTSGTNNGVVLRFNNIDYMGIIGTFTSGELKVGGFNAGGYFMTFYSNNAERMRLTPSGRLLIGTSTESTYELDVVGDIRSTLDANINGLTVGKGGGSVSFNTSFGVTALASNTTGNAITAVGYLAGNANTTSNYNTYIGTQSGRVATGANNTFVGSQSGFANTGGAQNTFLGTFAGYDVTTGTYNTLVGYNVGRGLTTGNYNTIIGGDVTGLSSSLSNTIILADGQGNQRLYINNSGNVGIGTTSPTQRLSVDGNARFYTTGANMTISLGTTFVGNTSLNLGAGTGGSFINADFYNLVLRTSNTDRLAIFSSTGNVLIQNGGGYVDAGYRLDVNGTARVSGTELRLDNATTGTINLYSATPSIQFASADPTNYRFYRSGTTMYWNSAGNIRLQIGGNEAYQIDAANGHIWRSVISGGAALARLTTGGNLMIGTTTDAGYKLDVNGSFRAGNIYSTIALNTGIIKFTLPTGGTSYYENGITLVSSGSSGNRTWIAYDGSNNLQIRHYAGLMSFQFDAPSTDFMRIGTSVCINSASTTSPAASAALDVTSTTKGFLPPRMTGTQAEAITSPAAGLMVYSTDGSGTTITSLGWWGYNGTTWVKLN
jgi:hypothetical protein